MSLSAFTLLVGLFLSATISACNKGNGTGVTKDTVMTETIIKNVAYGTDTAQRLDVYLPAGRDTLGAKVVLFVHGGSWVGGDKAEFNDAIAALRLQMPGYAMFNMNYRLAGSRNKLPMQLQDIQEAIGFIESKSNEYLVDVNKICLVGASAGAHLALLHAYKNNDEGRIKAVVDLFGPADLTDLFNNHPVPGQVRYVLTTLLGKPLPAATSVYQQASPVNFINAASVPTLIFHGSDDIVVPVSQSKALAAKLRSNNVKVEMTTYALEGHGWYGKNLLDTYSKTVHFIKENVK